MEFKKFFVTESGKTIISILLGLGFATLFRIKCSGINCYKFVAPSLEDIKKKKYKYGNKCFNYELESSTCDNNKKIINFA
jgi:hypothetical protein